MKIAVISASQVPSGTANSIQVMKVCQSLAQAGHEVCLWLPGSQSTTWPALAEHYGLTTSFEVRWLPAWPSLRRYDFAYFALRRARAWGAEAIYTWVLQAALFTLWQGLPLLLELHDRPSGKIGPWLYRQVARHKGRKRLLFITRALLQALEKEQGVALPEGEAVIAPDGVDIERYAGLPAPEAARRQLGLPPGLTAGYTGHLYPGRGADQLVALAKRFPEINFLWVGGRPADVEYWRVQIAMLGLANVRLTGFVPNQRIPLYQAAADVLLMPYEEVITGSSGGNTAEVCSPMKMFEYMAAGRAILSSDLPVLREVLNEGNALLCPPPPAGEAAWEAAFSRLISDETLRKRLSSQARRDVEEYAWLTRAERCLKGFTKG
jgi:glycosyltransferase involved in cell wall biosynthesis